MKILVVEDDPLIAELVVAILAGAHEVAHESFGGAALARLAREPFDLAILDVDLPDLRGIGIARAVRDFSTVPLIVTSGGLNWETDAVAAGANACLRKPYDPADLERVVDSVARVHAAPDSSDVQRLGPAELADLARLPRERLDALPFGAIRLDAEGRVVDFNSYESAASGRARDAVLGKRFADVAPCTTVREFVAAREACREGAPSSIRFVFPRHGASAVVTVRFFRDRGDTWLFVSQVAEPHALA